MSKDKKSDVLKVKVKIQSIGKEQIFKDGEFKKIELIGVAKDGEYENLYAFEFIQDKCKLVEDLIVGTKATIYFNIRCRKVEQEGKEPMYFTSLAAWKVDV